MLLYMDPISSTLRSRQLQFTGHCFIRVEEPIHSIVFFEPAGTCRPGGPHARVSCIKALQVTPVYIQPILILQMCIAARNHEKFTKTPYFWILRSFNVIDVGTSGKLVSSACYDKQQVCLSATVLTLDKLIAVR